MRDLGEAPVVEVRQRVHRAARAGRGARRRRARRRTGTTSGVNLSARPDRLGGLRPPPRRCRRSEPLSTSSTSSQAREQRRQHPRQRRRLVLDAQHGGGARAAGRPAGSRARRCRSRCAPRGCEVRRPAVGHRHRLAAERLAHAAADAGRDQRRAGRAGSGRRASRAPRPQRRPAGRALQLALHPLLGGDDGRPRDRLGLVVEVDVRLAQLVEGRRAPRGCRRPARPAC